MERNRNRPQGVGEDIRYDEWRDKDGKYHDGLGRVYDRKRDMLEEHMNKCGCGNCINRYRQHMMKVMEDRTVVRGALMYLGFLFWTGMGYSPDELEYMDDGEVLPIKRKLLGEDSED